MGLSDIDDRPVKRYSGGMRRRLDLAASLIRAPGVLLLDEPTTGLDPRGRSEVWAAIRALVAGGTAVLLTTQYLDEADQLAHQIVVIDSGRLVAQGTPTELKSRLGGDRTDVVVRDAGQLEAGARLLKIATGSTPDRDVDERRLGAPIRDRVAAMNDTLAAFAAAGIEIEDIALRRPTLDEVFVHLTGHAIKTEATAGEGSRPW